MVLFSAGTAETDIDEVQFGTVFWWPAVPEIFIPKIIKIGYFFIK